MLRTPVARDEAAPNAFLAWAEGVDFACSDCSCDTVECFTLDGSTVACEPGTTIAETLCEETCLRGLMRFSPGHS